MRELQIIGGRIALFVEWTDFTETEEGTLEEQRLEYKELLGEMAIYEEDLNGAELKHYNDLTTIAWWEHDETEAQARQTDQETREEEAETSGWVSPTHPAPNPIPLGTLRGSGESGRPPPHRVGGALWRRRSQGSHGKGCRWTEHAHVGANS